MIKFKVGKCPKCGKYTTLMFSNNPLNSESTICFDCIRDNIDYNNLSQADFFCRTYNLPYDPNIWIEFVNTYGDQVFEQYTSTAFENTPDQINLYYCASTRDLWAKANQEWEKAKNFTDILEKMECIKESYMQRSRMKWGQQYEFHQLRKLDSLYSRTIRANRITSPMQKEAVQTLCKIQLEMDEAIQMKDAKAIKDFSSSWSTFAKQAKLDEMIEETKTDDITTVAELYDYAESLGFQPQYYTGQCKDDIDFAIRDIQEADRRLILESTGLQATLEEMINKASIAAEQKHTEEVTSQTSLQDLLDFKAEDAEIETEDDSDVANYSFDEVEAEETETTQIEEPEAEVEMYG